MPDGTADEDRLKRAILALGEPERFQAAERRLAQAIPELQDLLARSLAEAGWLEPARVDAVDKAAGHEDPHERVVAIRSMLAEEARVAMLIGVAVGWELARELDEAPRAGDDPRAGGERSQTG
jgi:hypothetical protein